MTASPRAWTALLVVLSFSGTACSDICTRIEAFESECGRFKDKPVDSAQFIAQCQDGLTTKPPRRAVSERRDCAETAADCEAYVACHQEKRTARIVARIEENLAQKAPQDAVAQCDKFKQRLPEDTTLQEACNRAFAAYTETTEWFRVETTCRLPWVASNPGFSEPCGGAFSRGLTTAVKAEKYYDLKNGCASPYAKANKPAQAACKKVLKSTFSDLVDTMQAVRDGKAVSDKLWTRCSNLKTVGEATGKPGKAIAEALCKEAEAGTQVAAAVARATDEMKKERRTLPRECDNAMKKLAGLPKGDWRTAARAKVVTACYETLAPSILATTLPTMKHCAYAVRKVLEAVDRYKIEHPALTKHLAVARRKCKR